jgi:hypothetical protein
VWEAARALDRNERIRLMGKFRALARGSWALLSPVSPEHRLHGARDIRIAASGDVAARRKLGRSPEQKETGLQRV